MFKRLINKFKKWRGDSTIYLTGDILTKYANAAYTMKAIDECAHYEWAGPDLKLIEICSIIDRYKKNPIQIM